MAVKLLQTDEKYEVSTDKEAETLIADMKKEYDVTKTSSTYKHLKREDRDFYIVTIRKNFDTDDGIE